MSCSPPCVKAGISSIDMGLFPKTPCIKLPYEMENSRRRVTLNIAARDDGVSKLEEVSLVLDAAKFHEQLKQTS